MRRNLTRSALAALASWLVVSCGDEPEFVLETASPEGEPGRITISITAPSDTFWERHLRQKGQKAENQALIAIFRIESEGKPPGGATGDGKSAATPLLSTTSIEGRSLMLTPTVSLPTGGSYLISFDPTPIGCGTDEMPTNGGRSAFVKGKGPLTLVRTIPSLQPSSIPSPPTIHPTSPSLPANALKLYLTFAQPMEQSVFMERVHLLDAGGKEIPGPFRETELWSPDGKRLTIWIHPGRQKTGVNLNETEGAVLREGQTVTLKIDGSWRATNGQSLGRDQTQTLSITAADHTKPDPTRWKINAPKTGTRDPLTMMLDEPLDWALLHNSITVQSDVGQPLQGEITVSRGEREWIFTPRADWPEGKHQLIIDPKLEDLAGNSLERVFETLSDEPAPLGETKPAVLLFETITPHHRA